MMDLPVIVTVELPNGRWGHVYADDMPQAGMKPPGGHTYATKELAEEASKDRSDTVGQSRGMFDRFLLPKEPPPVEWPGDDETVEDEEHTADGGSESKQLMARLSKIEGLLTKLMKALNQPKE